MRTRRVRREKRGTRISKRECLKVVYGPDAAEKETGEMFSVAVQEYFHETHLPEDRARHLQELSEGWHGWDGWGEYLLEEIIWWTVWDALRACREPTVAECEENGEPWPSGISNPYTQDAYDLHTELCAFFEWAVGKCYLVRSPMYGISLPNLPMQEKIQ